MKTRLVALAFATVIATALAQAPAGGGNAPTNRTEATNSTSFWDCVVPGGNFTIALSKIASVSIHEFNVTGARVTEVNVDTEGSVCARFYFLEPLKIGGALSATEVIKERALDVADTVADHTGTDKVWRKVQKDYPIATHAHTVEYRLQTRDDLEAIHTSVKNAWTSGKGRTIKIVDEKEK